MKKYSLYFELSILLGALYSVFFAAISDLSIRGIKIAMIIEKFNPSVQTFEMYFGKCVIICTVFCVCLLYFLKLYYTNGKVDIKKCVALVLVGDLTALIASIITHFGICFYWLCAFAD